MPKHIITDECEYIKQYPAQSLLKTPDPGNEAWTNPQTVGEAIPPGLEHTKPGKLFLHSNVGNIQDELSEEGDITICTSEIDFENPGPPPGDPAYRQFGKLNAPLRAPAILEGGLELGSCFGMGITCTSDLITSGVFDCRGGEQVRGVIIPPVPQPPYPEVETVYGGGSCYLAVGVPYFNSSPYPWHECTSGHGQKCIDAGIYASTSSPGGGLAESYVNYQFIFRPGFISYGVYNAIFVRITSVITCATAPGGGGNVCYHGSFAPTSGPLCGYVWMGPILSPIPIYPQMRAYTGNFGLELDCENAGNWIDENGNYNDIPVINDTEGPIDWG